MIWFSWKYWLQGFVKGVLLKGLNTGMNDNYNGLRGWLNWLSGYNNGLGGHFHGLKGYNKGVVEL